MLSNEREAAAPTTWALYALSILACLLQPTGLVRLEVVRRDAKSSMRHGIGAIFVKD